MASSGRLLVAAIDFGTTYSGYAFSFRHEFETDPLKVSASTWTAGSRALVSLKTPTTVLLDKDKNFHSFGYEAEDYYSQLAEDDDHGDWYYFRRFKMMLYGKEGKGGLTRNIPLKDIRDKELPALKVFSEAIKYLKGHLLKALEKRATDVKDTDIEWVLTVPAIWNDPAKQFMREAAEVAGIKSDQLTIALEPEAASLYCKHLPVEKMGGSEQGFTCFSKGSKYLVLDAGGERTDVTVLEMQSDGSSKVIHTDCSWSIGKSRVVDAFCQMMTSIVGIDVMKEFKNDYSDDHKDMMEVLDTQLYRKCQSSRDKITMKIPYSLKECFEENGEDITDAIDRANLTGQLKWVGDKLRLDPNTFQDLCADGLDSTVAFVQNMLANELCKGTDMIIIIGEFSESPQLQERVKNFYSRMRIIIPKETRLVAASGAVLYGHINRHVTRQRKCPRYRHQE